MSLIFLSGFYANAIRRATLSSSPAALAGYPASNLGRGLIVEPFRLGSLAANAYVEADLNFVLNGGYETWGADGLPVSWKKGTGAGSLHEETTVVESGSSSLRIDGIQEAYQDVVVQTGRDYELAAALQGDGTRVARVRVQDLDTLKWLNSAGAWQVAVTDVFTRSIGSWNTSTRSFTVESPSLREHTTRLRVSGLCTTAGGSVYFDSFALYPEVDFVAVAGHNLPSGVTVELRYSNDGFDTDDNLLTTLTMARGAFYSNLTATLKRWWRIRIPEADDMGETPWLGEWVLGPYETMGRDQRWDWRVGYIQPQVRQSTGTGQLYSTRHTDRPMPGLELEFMAESEAERDQVFRDVFQAANWGDEPLIIVPDDTKPLVVHGRVGNTWEYPNEFDDTFTYGVRVDPDPYPTDLIGG